MCLGAGLRVITSQSIGAIKHQGLHSLEPLKINEDVGGILLMSYQCYIPVIYKQT